MRNLEPKFQREKNMADDKTTNGELCDDDELKADDYKLQANQFFKDGKYDEALSLYTKAIDLNPQVPAYYGNRSFCYIKTEYYGSALEDANKAIDLDKKYIKAYYRRASAYMALGKFKLSLKDYEMVTKFRPKDKDASLKYQECKKIVQRQAFEKAIAVDEKKSVASTVDLNSMVVEDEYDGPRLSENGVTEEFVGDLIERFTNQKKIHKKYAYEILLEVKKVFEKQPSMVDISIPENGKLTVCGDIHGQFYDLLNIFNLNGNPSAENPYLFNGDFVDRGSFSCEVIFTLFSFKLLYPDHFFMSRGNHESAYMNQMFGFEGEVKSKYTSDMADLFTEVYNWLPLCHLINEKVLSFENCYKALDCNGHSQENEDFEANNLFKNGKKYLKIVKASKKILPSHFQSEVMHGGLFKRDDVKLEELRTIDRNRQPGEEGLMCELLWSDPQPQPGRSPSKRGCGIHFGPDVTKEFCKSNDLEYIVRSHEVKPEGYEVVHDGKCITVFSAPNYCDQMGNKGAFITMGSDVKPNFTSYDAVPHPDVKPMAYANSFMSMFGFM